jgi:hypothetical protein
LITEEHFGNAEGLNDVTFDEEDGLASSDGGGAWHGKTKPREGVDGGEVRIFSRMRGEAYYKVDHPMTTFVKGEWETAQGGFGALRGFLVSAEETTSGEELGGVEEVPREEITLNHANKGFGATMILVVIIGEGKRDERDWKDDLACGVKRGGRIVALVEESTEEVEPSERDPLTDLSDDGRTFETTALSGEKIVPVEKVFNFLEGGVEREFGGGSEKGQGGDSDWFQRDPGGNEN